MKRKEDWELEREFKINISDGKCFPLGGVSISALDKIDLVSIKNICIKRHFDRRRA